MKPCSIFASLVVFAVLPGCATTPIRYLTLDMTPSGGVQGASAILIDEVIVSDALRRPELLVQARETEIEYYGDAHWVASLTELVTEKLEAEFGVAPADENATWLKVKVWQFGENETVEPRCGHVKLTVAGWNTGTPGRDVPDWSASYDECVPVDGNDVSDVATALSKGLEVIALQIAQKHLNP